MHQEALNNKKSDHCDCPPPLFDKQNPMIKTLLTTVFIIGLTLFIATFFTNSILIVYLSYFCLGYSVIINSIKLLLKKDFFNENMLMTLATIGAIYTQHYEEAIAVMLFYIIGEFLQDRAVDKSNRSIEAILNIMPEVANKKTDHGIITVQSRTIEVGDTIVVKNGERVALDGVIIKGASSLDLSSLTGESFPKPVQIGYSVMSGAINLGSVIEIKVEKAYSNSTISRILDLIKSAGDKKTKTEQYLRRIARIYTPIVFLLALIVWLIPPLVTQQYNFNDWLYNALILLVISCPCALTLSIPLSFFSAIGKFSKSGILVKGSQYIESLTKIQHIVFDKTGTLTQGQFQVAQIKLFNDYNEDALLKVVFHIENLSNHPLAIALKKHINHHFKDDVPALAPHTNLEIKEIQGHGMHAIIDNDDYYIGNYHLLDRFDLILAEEIDLSSLTTCFVFKNKEHIATIMLEDQIKYDSKTTVNELKKIGVKTYILSGDNKDTANKVGDFLGIDHIQSNLLPGQKLSELENIMVNGITAFVGDGINDAPALKRADIGISMGGIGSSVAIEASDIVIMTDEPSRIIKGIKIAQKTKFVLNQNIIFALSVKTLFIILGIMGMMNMWWTIFADVGVSLLTVINSLRILK